ncbi:MAG: translation initiation factor IF-2 [Bacteroidales bacterium]|nr:translation initiation factor IF-2 [Bacteroidales bacterium]
MTSEAKPKRLSIVARELNVGTSTIVQFLENKGFDIGNNPNAKIPVECLDLLNEEYKDSKTLKEKAIINTEKAKETKISNISEEKAKEQEQVEQSLPEKETPEVKVETETSEKIKETTTKPVTKKVEEKKEKEEKKGEKVKETKETKKVKETKEVKTPKETKELQKEKEKEITKPEEVKDDTKTTELPNEDTDNKEGLKVLGTINLDTLNQKTRPKRKTKEEKHEEKIKKVEEQKKSEKSKEAKTKSKPTPKSPPKKEEIIEKPIEETKPVDDKETKTQKEEDSVDFIKTKVEKLAGPNIVGKIDIGSYLQRQEESEKKKKKEKEDRQKQRDKEKEERKSKRKRIKKVKVNISDTKNQTDSKKKKPTKKTFKPKKTEISEEDVQKQIKETLARLTSPKQKSKASKHRRDKRDLSSQKREEELQKTEAEKHILKVTEFVSVNELSTMMDVPATNLIATCMSLGLFVSINQRLDAETMALVANEYGFEVEFVSADVLSEIDEIVDDPEDLQPRPPIVTVMGHVDHGKTRLLDQIRNANVIDGEAGGITQHIGAYSVKRADNKVITFLDTPGHEAFTAMRARGAQITDVAIIVIAADDSVMPQTIEAINHASAAGVPIVFAINKIDKPTSNPDKIREALSQMNYLVEEWGGKYQSQEISAKQGINIEELLEKVLLESEMLDLKANPDRHAVGAVIESSLDKGRGYVATLLVQTGTLKVGDILLAGCQTGRVKAMYNERGKKIDIAEPSTPVLVLGLNGAPQAGDKFNVLETDHEARDLANKRLQLQREQGLRTQKHITLDEIGRRLALGDFNEINIIVKGDVDGSVEALADSLIKLSKDNFNVNIIHKAVGQISESDIMLAAASNAIIVGFQVRPSSHARKIAEKEEIEIRLYSIIYDAINEIKDAMEGMLQPTLKESITGSAEIRETFKITKVGTIAGCMVTDGKIFKKSKVRVIRDGIVIYTGELGSLKRFKDDVKEVSSGYECGLNIDKFNDIKVGDIVEAFEEVEVKQKL